MSYEILNERAVAFQIIFCSIRMILKKIYVPLLQLCNGGFEPLRHQLIYKPI